MAGLQANTPVLRLLLTEDNAADAELELRELKRAGLRIAHRVADTEQGFVSALREFCPDVILSDFSMPGFDGMAALALARELAPDTPFVFVSGTLGEEYAIRALRNGATDYVLKTNLMRLPAAVERAFTESKERRERRRLTRIREFSSRINWALVRLRERDELFAAISRIAVEVGGLRGARIGMLDPGTKDVIWKAWFGSWSEGGGPDALQASARDDESGSGLAGKALRELAPAISNDIASDSGVRQREKFVSFGIKAMAAFPLIVDGAAAGVLALQASEVGYFDQDEVNLLAELAANVSFALELMHKQERITYLALYDPLTGLPNRTLFHERLTQSLQSAVRNNTSLALVLIDLERFKAINDTLGQQAGDGVLQAVAQRLGSAAGDINRLARLGSNLFAVMVRQIRGAGEVARWLEQVSVQVFGTPFAADAREARLAAKAGIAMFPEDGADADALLRNAEASLKRAKETGEAYLFYAPHINARVSEEVELEHRLRKAVERGELFFHYQPKLDLVTRRIVGLEALMRWKAPDGALVPPVTFIPVLEQTGLILEAGRQAIAAATGVYRGWQAQGLEPPRIAVNVSQLQLRRKTFVEDVRGALRAEGADGGGVDLEITESLLMHDVDESIRKLAALRDLGLRISLDDFGTGFSSLAYLSRLPLDTLKIDRGFVQGMTENPHDTSIVGTIISLAQALRLKVVAEGVETEQQAQLLRLLRCDQGQGFLFSRPVPAEEIEALLKK
ncbi:MAG TPA: EAL domain-containing protein [Burkholderiales bacterium]|nr:EAL domain-containing protein [Burkholderiales bacterium]